jgi:hypothetical protein
MTLEKEKNYYLRKKRVLMRTFDAALSIVKPILIKHFNEDSFDEILHITRNDFEKLLPQIPYVGGNKNPLTEDLVNSAILIPILRFFQKKGINFSEIGKITYELFETFNSFIPPKEDIFTEDFLNKEKENAKKSKLRRYPDDWVFDFVEGDGKNFDFGVDYSECGVYKFYKSQGLEHLMPIICVSDFAKARAYGYGLSRTQTIGNGAPYCDFRYIKSGKSPRGWPLESLPEYKKK